MTTHDFLIEFLTRAVLFIFCFGHEKAGLFKLGLVLLVTTEKKIEGDLSLLLFVRRNEKNIFSS